MNKTEAGRKNKDGYAWTWSDNTVYEYENFDKGQPDNYGGINEECVAILGKDKGWHDAPCIVKLNYLCQKCPIGGGDCGGAGRDRGSDWNVDGRILLGILIPTLIFLLPGAILGCYFWRKAKKREAQAPNEVKRSGAGPEPGMELDNFGGPADVDPEVKAR